jgi:flagellar biosynthesis chaperone FliJ
MLFGWGDCVMGRPISGHLNESAAEPEKRERRAAAHKIRKMIRKCKADTKAIRQLDDEQTEYLERLRKHL